MEEQTRASLRIVFGSVHVPNARRDEPRSAFGMLVMTDGLLGEISQSLCDDMRNTRELTELCALQACFEIAEEISSLGRPNAHQDRQANRFAGQYKIEVEIVQLLPEFFENATGSFMGQNRKLWDRVTKKYKMLKDDVKFTFTYADENDEEVQAAQKLARDRLRAGIYGAYHRRAFCVSCSQLSETAEHLYEHIKTKHMGRDVVDESIVASLTDGFISGKFTCVRCHRVYDSQRGILRHMKKAHFPDVFDEELVVNARRLSGKFGAAPSAAVHEESSNDGSEESENED